MYQIAHCLFVKLDGGGIRLDAYDSLQNVLVVPNQYALRVAAALDFSRLVEPIRHCLQRHAMAELQVRQTHGNVDDAEAKRILTFSNAAFAARLRALSVAEAKNNAEEGLARWRRF
ncbi:hypothetical protein P3T76_015593 [Phytophthora citrophthora]|uniref:Uncharacterized protein n=1 Tax=Phytophthora citrophthora TaxID=4793 RepID=A0AAD9FZ46_9STRA|nr:hypothetical protein P3T76_015593 [Phytophthora citrophthora]